MKKLRFSLLPCLLLCLLTLWLPMTARAAEPTLSPKYPSVSFEGAVECNIYFALSNGDGIAPEDLGLLVFETLPEEGTVETADARIDGAVYDSAKKLYVATTPGIPAKNLGDRQYFKLYARLSDGSYVYSKTIDYSILDYAHNVLTASGSTQEAKDLVTAALQYGAAAQKFFSYRTDTLADRGLATGGHLYEDTWQVVTKPTLTEPGLEQRLCTICGAEPQEREIPCLTVSALVLTSEPNKTAYYINEVFDPTGMEVTALLSDGSQLTVTDYTLDKTLLTPSDTSVTVSYQGHSVSVPVTVSAYELVSVSGLQNVADDTTVVVEGYVAGVAEEGPSTDKELLLKDTQTDAIISVRNIPFGSFPDYGYAIGDQLRFVATMKLDGTVNTPNKRYLDFSAENTDQAATVISTSNSLTYQLDNVITVSSWEQLQSLFTLGNVAEYSYIRIEGPIYVNRYSGSDGVGISRLHMNEGATGISGIRTDGSHTLSLRDNVMAANLGEDWSALFFEQLPKDSQYPGTRLTGSMTAVYTGGNNYYFQLTVLDEDWVQLAECSNEEALLTAANAYYLQGTQIQYDQTNRRRNLNPAPEAATGETTLYLDCSSYVNSVYRTAFGVNVMDNDEVPTTKKYIDYCADGLGTASDVIGYWVNADYTTQTQIDTILEEVRQQLQVGDALVYRHGETSGSSGHVYVYIGQDEFLHCTGSSYSYGSIPSESVDKGTTDEKTGGAIQLIHADEIFTNTESKRYLFKTTASDTVYSFGLLRPLNRGLTPTADAKSRVRLRGLSTELSVSAGQYAAVFGGESLTYTLTMTNPSAQRLQSVPVQITLPEQVSFVSSADMTLTENVLTWTGNVAANATVTLTWTVEVNTDANGLITAQGTVGGISTNLLTNTVSSYTAEQLQTLAQSAADRTGETFSDPMELVQTVYGTDLFDGITAQEALDQLIDSTNNTCRTDTALSSLLVPDLYGGLDINTGYITDCARTRLVRESYLTVGDVIIGQYGEVTQVLIYLGEGQLVSVSSTDGVCAAVTSTGDEFSGTNLFATLISYDRYALLRPSRAD